MPFLWLIFWADEVIELEKAMANLANKIQINPKFQKLFLDYNNFEERERF